MNIKTGILIFLLLFVAFYSTFSLGKSDNNVEEGFKPSPAGTMSGTVENGLRIIPVKTDGEDLFLTVYRGDYIVIEVEAGLKPAPTSEQLHRLVIPSLDIDRQIPVPETEKSYIKMKETGDIEFSIDDIRGVIRVIDFEGPRYWELSSDEGADLIKDIDPFILDVRTKGEYLEGHLKDAYLLPVQILEREIGVIEKYKDQDILIYCRSGNRSTVASKILIDAGFTNVYNLRYGISEWTADGYSVVVE